VDRTKFNDRKEFRKFGIGLGILLAAVATLQWVKGHSAYPVVGGAGAAVALVSWIVPAAIKPLYILFAYLGEGLGWFSTRVILVALFCILVTPIGLVMRLFGKQFMPMAADPKEKSYWTVRNKTYMEKEFFENQF
jgi:hypothetical protein